jgi:hypothetical protein
MYLGRKVKNVILIVPKSDQKAIDLNCLALPSISLVVILTARAVGAPEDMNATKEIKNRIREVFTRTRKRTCSGQMETNKIIKRLKIGYIP